MSSTYSDQLLKSMQRRIDRPSCLRPGACTGVMNAMSKSVDDIWYGFRLPTRRFAASLRARPGETASAGSTGRMRPRRRRGVLHLLLRRRDDVAHILDADDAGVPSRCLPSFSSSSDVIPTTPPPAVKTGPPALPVGSSRSDDDGVRLHALDGAGFRALLLAERRADREDLLPFHDRRLRRLTRTRAARAAPTRRPSGRSRGPRRRAPDRPRERSPPPSWTARAAPRRTSPCR